MCVCVYVCVCVRARAIVLYSYIVDILFVYIINIHYLCLHTHVMHATGDNIQKGMGTYMQYRVHTCIMPRDCIHTRTVVTNELLHT